MDASVGPHSQVKQTTPKKRAETTNPEGRAARGVNQSMKTRQTLSKKTRRQRKRGEGRWKAKPDL